MTGKVTVGGQLKVTGDIRTDGKLRIRNPAGQSEFTDSGTTTDRTFTVPAGVTILSMQAQGAGGRSDNGATGGRGAGIRALFHVRPGDVIRLRTARDGASGASAQIFRGDTLIAGAGSGGDAGAPGNRGDDGRYGERGKGGQYRSLRSRGRRRAGR
ncbi:hypothetical protein ABDE16_08975 [Streptomyces sp. BRB040]|uniref:hypothetical protein n=1 Tax=Streptomyces sp. BRB040 TaxID=3142634 RepID=UPI0031F6135F